MTDDERAIRQLIETWMTATRAGDLQTVLALMADDVVFMTPGQEPFGRERFAAASQQREQQKMRVDGSAEIKELRVLGDWAYVRTYIEVTVTPETGTPVTRKGYTLTLMRKEPDGRWVLARDANMVV